MKQFSRTLAFTVLGIALAAYGIYHAAASYPGPGVFATFNRELPTITAVASFYFGVAAVLVGLILLLPVIYWLNGQQARKVPVHFGSQRPAGHREDDHELDPDTDPYGSDPEGDERDYAYHGNAGYDAHHRGYGGYPHAPGRNGRLDRGQLVGVRR